jgi:hypothetical protein
MPLDIGVGLLLGILLSGLTTINYGLCLGIGVFASLLPDLDFIWQYIKFKVVPRTSHRDSLHYPVLFVPTVGIVGWLIQPYIGLIFALGALIHFMHDSIGVGFGVKWLFPVKKNSYLFLYQTGLPTNKDMPRKIIHSWNDHERQQASEKYRDPDWIKHIYFSVHPFGIFEYTVLVVGCIAAFLH